MTDDFIVEQPQESDFDALRGLFVSTLEPHYDGDHDAHLTRLINAHRANGQDANGFNSLAQLGYVARQEPGGRPVGYINLAVKRHGTAKISPLIVDPSARRRGVGEALLNAAPHDVRLLYCTVSEDNLNARTFFFRQGFVQVGTAPDQYRRGKTELILQRPRLRSGVKATIRSTWFVSRIQHNGESLRSSPIPRT
ncbi:GNAT family N-acetyltransferase [Corynebacterium belfantii]|uniref:GNAT family N-acetyltransferase n=1 Tax=Corynebacterium belfantii TaxID=2014537 RepID=UPI001A7E77AF|nr:GNAT family N-acetyltransferase [Corynebacterium belfantii]